MIRMVATTLSIAGLATAILAADLADERVAAVPVAQAQESRLQTADGISRVAETAAPTAAAEELPAPPAIAEPVAAPVSVAAGAGGESLDSLVAEALRQNKELLASRQDREQYLGKSHYERRNWFPKLEAYHIYESQPDTPPGGQTDRTWRKGYGLRGEQLLFDWGETGSLVRKERYSAKAASFESQSKELDVARDVTEAYWRAVFFQEIVDLRTRALQARQKEVESLQQQLQARSVRPVEVTAADARRLQAEQDLLEATNGFDLSKRRLQYLVGREPDGNISVAGRLSSESLAEPGDLDVRQHPDIKRVQAAQEAAEAAIRAATRGRLPKVTLRAGIEDSTPEPGALAGNLAPDGYLYQVGVYMSIPLGAQWVGGSGKQKEARAKLDQLLAEEQALEGAIKLQVQQAGNRLQEAIKAVEVSAKRRQAAQEQHELTRQLAESKQATQADLAQAEEESAQASVGYLRALYDVQVAEADLRREMGRALSQTGAQPDEVSHESGRSRP